MERLRDRTDELELIISSLTIFALVAAPGWLFDIVASVFTHLSTSLVIAVSLGLSIFAGTCYGLAACFIVHLMARAYWVGLIGLRTVFPDGINWQRTPGFGPLSRQFYRERLPDLDVAIKRTDKLASSLFAVISMLTLSLLWLGAVLVAVMVVAGAIGARAGQTNAGMGIGGATLIVVFIAVPLLAYLLDAQLAARVPALQNNRGFVAVVRLLRRIAGFAYPQRLVLPVQLTLQTNTRPVVFSIALIVGLVGMFAIGNARFAAWSSFTLSSEFTYLSDEDVAAGLRSTYYEDMASSFDRLRAWPRVDSFNQNGSYLRLFLPYQPVRDNLVLDTLCAGAEETSERVACLQRLWAVSIEGATVSMATFQPAERADLAMRGLIGLVPLADLEPGLRSIEVIWNPDAADDDAPIDDRYTEPSRRFVIPIAFSPTFEATLREPAADSPAQP